MKNTMKKTKITGIIAIIFVAVFAMTTLFSVGVSAAELKNPVKQEIPIRQEIQQKYKYNEKRFEDLQIIKRRVDIDNSGVYQAKDVKLYGRRILYVSRNTGEFVLGDWECIMNYDTINAPTGKYFKIDGTYVQFAFSYDITWGTNYPYSGIFYTDAYNIYQDDIYITLSGAVRTAGINIKVGDRTVVDESNLSSHKEWKPSI